MKNLLPSFIVIGAIVGVTIGAKVLLEKFAPEAEKKPYVASLPVVETKTVEVGDFDVLLTSEGVVQTRRDTILSAQVAGRIDWVDPGFEVGASYKSGDLIAQIDKVDYEAAVAQAKSVLAQTELALIQEEARAEQAARDWQKIGGAQKASDLVLRLPFVKSARANREAAEEGLAKALADLKRTDIKAPFDCRIRSVNLNVGATVAPGTQLGLIYDPAALLVRLPFSLAEFDRIPQVPTIVFFTEINGTRHEWKGEMLWELGEVDRQTLSAYVLVKVLPKEGEGRFQLPPAGIFLKAELTGAKLSGVVKVPRSAVRERDQVFVLGPENRLRVRKLTIVRRDAHEVYASAGIKGGEKVIMNRIEMPVEGTELIESSGQEPSVD